MRWDELFADLAAGLDAHERAALSALDAAAARRPVSAADDLHDVGETDAGDPADIAERARGEWHAVRLVDRMAGAVGQPVSVTVAGAGAVTGRLAQVGPDWALVDLAGPGSALLALPAVLSVAGLTRATRAPGSEGRVAARWTLPIVLRGLARNRFPVTVTLVDGGVSSGTLDRVGADFVEVAEHPPGELRRHGEVLRVRTVHLSGIAVVRTWT